MVISLYRFVPKSRRMEDTKETPVSETTNYDPLNFEDFEEAKDRYRALAERFDLLAGYHTPRVLKKCMEGLGYAECGIGEIENMRRDFRGIIEVPDPERRKRIERYFVENSSFGDIVSDILENLDKVWELLEESKEQDPILPDDFEIVSRICDLDLVVGNYLEINEAEEQIRKKILEEIKKAGLSAEATKFLTTNLL